jgi:hypothetical protein
MLLTKRRNFKMCDNRLGYKMRTGGGLPDKVFGAFSLKDEADADNEGPSPDHSEATAWAARQNEQARMCGREAFVFAAVVPADEAEGERLYAMYLATMGSKDFSLYR